MFSGSGSEPSSSQLKLETDPNENVSDPPHGFFHYQMFDILGVLGAEPNRNQLPVVTGQSPPSISPQQSYTIYNYRKYINGVK